MHCGKDNVEHTHVLWDRPIISQKGANAKLCSLDATALPVAIKCGLPITVSPSMKGNYWIESEDSCETVANDVNSYENKASTQDYEVKRYLEKNQNLRDINATRMVARQTLNTIKTHIKGADLLTPSKCFVDAPESINVYTDGSWINPMEELAHGGQAGLPPLNKCRMLITGNYCRLVALSSKCAIGNSTEMV